MIKDVMEQPECQECETKGCDLVLFDESDGIAIWHCARCGLETWEEHYD